MDRQHNEQYKKNLDKVINAVRSKSGSPMSREPGDRMTTFCGRKVIKSETQSVLDRMTSTDRIDMMSEHIELSASEQLHNLVNTSKSSESDQCKKNARAFLDEWGSVVGYEDAIIGDEGDGMGWVDESYLKKLYRDKSSINYLLSDE